MADKEMATIYIFGKKYDVPAELTIMNAMEYPLFFLKLKNGQSRPKRNPQIKRRISGVLD